MGSHKECKKLVSRQQAGNKAQVTKIGKENAVTIKAYNIFNIINKHVWNGIYMFWNKISIENVKDIYNKRLNKFNYIIIKSLA